MKKKTLITMMLLPAIFLFGCSGTGEKGGSIKIDGIKAEDINEFYYTYENINFNACYQRYLFHVVDGKHMFFHDKRENPGEYGWLSEEYSVRKGDFELTDEEWQTFLEIIKDGKVVKRQENLECGGSGPWMFIYAGNDTKGKEYYFQPSDQVLVFEEFCEKLAESGR